MVEGESPCWAINSTLVYSTPGAVYLPLYPFMYTSYYIATLTIVSLDVPIPSVLHYNYHVPSASEPEYLSSLVFLLSSTLYS